jgi:hypothetical protein
VGEKLFEAYWYKNGSLAGYYTNLDEKYIPEQQANIGVVQIIDQVIINNCGSMPTPLQPPPSNMDCSKNIWQLPLAFDYANITDLVPQATSVSLDVSATAYATVQAGVSRTQINEGPSACWFGYYTASYAVGTTILAAEVGTSGSVGLTYNTSDKPFDRNSLAGPQCSFAVEFELKGPLLVAGVGFGGVVAVDLSIKDFKPKSNGLYDATSITIKGGVSASAGLSMPVNGSITWGESTSPAHICDHTFLKHN